MTDRQKIEILKKAPHILKKDLTAEEREFLDSNPPRELQLVAWEETPGTLEHTILTNCTAEEIQTAAAVLRKIRDAWIKAGDYSPDMFDRNTDAGELLELLEHYTGRTDRHENYSSY